MNNVRSIQCTFDLLIKLTWAVYGLYIVFLYREYTALSCFAFAFEVAALSILLYG